MANSFTEWLNAGAQGQPILAAVEEIYIYVVLGLLAAIANWITKRKQAAKRDQLARTVPTQPSKTKTTGESTSWLGRLEQLVETQLGETDQKLEREYADDYEEESVDLPPVIGTSAPTLPPLFGTAQEAFRDTPLTSQLREAEQASVARKTAPTRSPVYDSPIYTGNIAHHIGTDIRAARQAVVGSIILGAPRSLESPGQITRQ